MESFRYVGGALHCEDVPVSAIAAEVGSPVYIYSAATLRNKYQAIATAFAAAAPTVCYSVKSCSSLGVLKVLRDAGCSFDVVSGGELFRVLKAGGDPRKVVYAGVGKTDREIRFALEQGLMMFNVESEEELANIDRLARQLGKIAPVALRLNPDVDPKTHRHTTTGTKENKFGLDLTIAGQIVAEIGRYPGVRLNGVHVHLGSPLNTTAPYAEALDKVETFLGKYASTAAPLDYINTGGGFGLLYKEENVPEFSAYAAEIVSRVKKLGRKLILEPGRSIVGNAGILLSTVQYVKSNGEKNFIIVDTGMHHLIRPAFYDSYHRIWPANSDVPPPAEPSGDQLVKADVVGPICESSDCFAKDRLLPAMKRGDLLAIFSAGAYGFAMASNYNSHPRPAEVLVDGAGWRVIRKRETWDDLVALETA